MPHDARLSKCSRLWQSVLGTLIFNSNGFDTKYIANLKLYIGVRVGYKYCVAEWLRSPSSMRGDPGWTPRASDRLAQPSISSGQVK